MKMEGNYPDEVILQAIQKYEIEVERQGHWITKSRYGIKR